MYKLRRRLLELFCHLDVFDTSCISWISIVLRMVCLGTRLRYGNRVYLGK